METNQQTSDSKEVHDDENKSRTFGDDEDQRSQSDEKSAQRTDFEDEEMPPKDDDQDEQTIASQEGGNGASRMSIERDFHDSNANDQPKEGDGKEELTGLDKELVDLEEKRKKECFGNMEKIEKEFQDLKEKFFNEKIEALKKEYEAIKSGTHQGFMKKSKELEEIRDHKVWAAEKWREYQLKNIENIYEGKKKQAEDEYKTDKKALREKMMNAAVEKKKKLQEEKSTMSLQDGADRVQRQLRSRKGQKDPKDQPGYKRRLNPPHINYTLKENEIVDDLALIQKGISSHPSYGKWPKKNDEVFADRGRLYYHNQTFEKGKDVFIESKSENGKWHGSIIAVNPAEIHVKSPDGVKNRFLVNHFRSGRYTITLVS